MDIISLLKDPELWDYSINQMSNRFNLKDKQFYSAPINILMSVDKIVGGEYKFNPPVVKRIPKDNGKFREVLVLEGFDAVAMRVITDIYSSTFTNMISNSVYSYREGIDTIAPIKELQKVIKRGIKIDISKFFDSVSMERIEATIKSIPAPEGVNKTLIEFYKDNRVRIGKETVNRFKSIAQGISFSAFLSNIILRDFDEFMMKRFRKYIRYSDDMIVELYDEQDFEVELKVIQEELLKFGLEVNDKKCKYYEDEINFLGCIVNKNERRLTDVRKSVIKRKIKSLSRGFKPNSRTEQKRYIKEVMFNLFNPHTFYGSGFNAFKITTNIRDISEINGYLKQVIRQVFTGKGNYTNNKNKTSDAMLKELGCIDLVDLYYKYQTSRLYMMTFLRSELFSFIFDESFNIDGIKDVLITEDNIAYYIENVHSIDIKGNYIKTKDGKFFKVVKHISLSDIESKLYRLSYSSQGARWKSPIVVLDEEYDFSGYDVDNADRSLKELTLLVMSTNINVEGKFYWLEDVMLLKEWFNSEVS